MNSDERLMLYWIDPVDATDCLAANLTQADWLKSFTFTTNVRILSKDHLDQPEQNKRLVYSCDFNIRISGGAAHCTVFLSFICFMGIHHFPDSIAGTVQCMVHVDKNVQYMDANFYLYACIFLKYIYQLRNVSFPYISDSEKAIQIFMKTCDETIRFLLLSYPYMTQKRARGRIGLAMDNVLDVQGRAAAKLKARFRKVVVCRI